MALQELSPLPRITGPEQLGAAISHAGERYAATKRQDQLLDRARAEQLADVASNRAYAAERYDIERFNRLSDQQKLAAQQIRQAMVAEAVREKLISLNEIDDEAKVVAAVEEMGRRGLLTKYQKLIETGVLKVADVQNPLAVDTAMQTEADTTAKLVAQGREQMDLQQKDFTRLRQEEAEIQRQVKALTDDLQKTADYVPSAAEIANAALALAWPMAKDKKNGPSKEELEAQRPTAIQQLREAGMQNAMIERQMKTVQLNALYQQLQAIKANTQEYIRKGIGPSVMTEAPAAAPTPSAVPAPTASASPMQSFQEMLSARAAPAPAPAATPVAAQTPGLAPVASIKGVLQRAPTGEQLVQAPGRLVNTVGRYGGALLQGLWNGDYSVPERGLVDMASDTLASGLERATAPGRPITNAPAVFQTPTNWWSGGR